jgi:D-alanyl-D-alanine carboxypeptidase
MNLDPTQIMLLALLVSMGADKLFVGYLISLLARSSRAPALPPSTVVVSGPGLPPPVLVPSPAGPGVAQQPPVSPAPAEPTVVIVPPVVVAPTLPPPVVVPPLGIAIPRFTHITATSFAGANDSANSKTSAYTGREIDSSKPGFALPKHLAAADQHRLIRGFWGGKTVDGPVEDVGPWYDGRPGWPIDAYWETGTRPRAETDNRTNHAGIDLTPGAWKALGHPNPEGAKDYISWDFVDQLGPVVPGVPGVPTAAAPSVTPSAPVAGGMVLVKQNWPKQSEAMAFFGNPRSAGWEAANLVYVPCPWVLTNEDEKTKTNHIRIHKKCFDSLSRVLNFIWEHPSINRSQAQIDAWGYNIFSGSYVGPGRVIAGTNTLSEHAYGGALDIWSAENQRGWTEEQTKFKPNSLITVAFEDEGWRWGGRWGGGTRDAMHYQALGT